MDLGRVFEKGSSLSHERSLNASADSFSGQSYVALSRATSLDGLQVLRFDPSKVNAHDTVVQWSVRPDPFGPTLFSCNVLTFSLFVTRKRFASSRTAICREKSGFRSPSLSRSVFLHHLRLFIRPLFLHLHYLESSACVVPHRIYRGETVNHNVFSPPCHCETL